MSCLKFTIHLIAEGIETYEELDTLVNLGVQYGQGFFIQKPDSKVQEIRKDVLQDLKKINMKKTIPPRIAVQKFTLQIYVNPLGKFTRMR